MGFLRQNPAYRPADELFGCAFGCQLRIRRALVAPSDAHSASGADQLRLRMASGVRCAARARVAAGEASA